MTEIQSYLVKNDDVDSSDARSSCDRSSADTAPLADVSSFPLRSSASVSPDAPAASSTNSMTAPWSARVREVRTPFAERVDEADDALKLEATDEEKLLFGHWIVGAWEDVLSCRDCAKTDDEVLACAKRTVVREDGVLRPTVMRCERYQAVCNRRRTERLFGQSRIGTRFQSRTFETFETDETNRRAYELCRKLADDFPHTTRGLLLSGGCGSGKTHLAAAIVHALLRRGCHALFLTSGRYLDTLKGAFGNAELLRSLQEEVRCAALLVLDDLGAEHTGDWSRSELFSLLNDRYENMRPTVLTTNLSLAELTARLGERTVSRIAEMTDGVRLRSPDRRLMRHMNK